MKVTDVRLTLFAWDGIPSTRYTPQTGTFSGSSRLGLVTIDTDEGISGHAFLGSSMRGGELDGESMIKFLKPVVMGQDPLDRERLFQEMWLKNRMATYRAIGAMDVALWDIGGKVAGLPVHKLLGSYRRSALAYASSAVLPAKEAYAEEALRYKEAGWKAYKVHPPADPAADIEVCTAVRKAVGDGFTLMLDAVWAYYYPDALKVGKAIEEMGYFWYEDPLPEDDIFGYVKLKQHLEVPILATEFGPTGLAAYAPWLVHRATDYLRGDVAVKGGITPVVKAAHLAEAFNMNYEVHHGGNSLNNVANLHVIMAVRNCGYFEVLLPPESQKYGLVEDIEVDKDGLVHALEGPGLGAEIDFGLIEKKKVAVIS